jgi:hypothetical protein
MREDFGRSPALDPTVADPYAQRTFMHVVWFLPIGFFIGTYGTLIGAGGGFILVPLLLLLYPNESPSLVTATSLSVVFVNSLSGSIAYARARRIGWKTGLLFALATIPGALAGSFIVKFIPRAVFGDAFGCLLILVSLYLFISGGRRPAPRAGTGDPVRIVDLVTDATGATFPLTYSLPLGLSLSLAIGFFSSLAGIGGGVIHVPVMTSLLFFPVHVAIATSQFILIFTSLAGVLMHLADGTYTPDLPRLAFLSAGVVAGAQVGARLSRRLAGPWIVRMLALALLFAGGRLLWAML